MSDDKNTMTDEEIERAMWPECNICHKKAEDIEKHIIAVHFKDNIDNDLAKWLLDLKKDMDSLWDWMKPEVSRRGRRS